MSEQILKETKENSQTLSKGCQITQGQSKGWLKGWLPMAICCSVPLLLLVLAIPLLGISLPTAGNTWLSIAVLLACPVGMYLMMRMMNKK